ncbi:nicotinate-nucleotide adenylyltransferase [Candidatus Bipolaricaulota bacterium]|nr:nicotinate-nucleotide adenylyltransferase [Candidatus Bipolaricaulota bacterium]
MNSSRRVGLFGGTFDPIHNAHLEVAKNAIEQVNLDEVIFIPSKNPPHKNSRGVLDAVLRYEMVGLAVEDYEVLEVSGVEIEREGPSYTIDTIKKMKEDLPEIVFIVGADNLINIDTWKQPEELLDSCPFVIAPRGGYKKSDFHEEIFQGADLRFLDMDEISISSTEIRERVADGRPIGEMVPTVVLDFIMQKGLYKAVPEGV